MPLRFSNTQLPPMRSDFSKQSNGIPRSCSALTAVMPEEPAPITQTLGSSCRCCRSSSPDMRLRFRRADAGLRVQWRAVRPLVGIGVAGQAAVFGGEHERAIAFVALRGEVAV